MKISIIIPVYNSEKYLRRCFDSILNIQKADYEVIVVNDGSSDFSENICMQYENQLRNFIYLEQENHGVSVARNLGVQNAHGDYLLFMDADDELNAKAVDEFFKSDSPIEDIICFDYTTVDNTSVYHKRVGILEDGDNNINWLEMLYTNRNNSIWNNLYKRNLIVNNKCKFCPSMRMGEDFLFNLNLGEFNPSIKYVSRSLYYYHLDNENNAMKKINLNYINDYMKLNQALETHYLSMKKEMYSNWICYFMNQIMRLIIFADINNESKTIIEFENSDLYNRICHISVKNGKEYLKKFLFKSKLYKNNFVRRIINRIIY